MSLKNELKNVKTLLLDLDGTLINSEKAFFESFKNVLENKFNILITKDDYRKYELEQNAMLIKKLRENHLILDNFSDFEIMTLIYNDYENEFRKIILEEEAIENFQLLKKLKEFKLNLALVTTCRQHYLDILIEQLELQNLFDIIVAREDVKNLKPSPDAYLKALKYLDIGTDQCLAIEDSKRGIDSAINSGLKVIQVNNFTALKYIDERAKQSFSANEVLNEILKIKKLKK